MVPRRLKVNPHILGRRERIILYLFAEGYKNKEIAGELKLSEQAVKDNQATIMRKLNAPNKSSLIRFALKNRFISIYEVLEHRYSERRSEAKSN